MYRSDTISYYNRHAADYCASTIGADMSVCRRKFTAYLTLGAHILDAGCGSGRDSLAFRKEGYRITAIDGSPVMCEEAGRRLEEPVRCITFEEIGFQNEFDGIWACASLLHVRKSEMKDVLGRLHVALKAQGILYASFKYGDGERNVGGRIFSDYTENGVKALMEEAGFQVLEVFLTQDVRKERAAEKWVNVIGRAVSATLD